VSWAEDSGALRRDLELKTSQLRHHVRTEVLSIKHEQNEVGVLTSWRVKGTVGG